jgi:N-methylhydantoinase A
MLEQERVPPSQRCHSIRFDCRYLKQYHEVSFEAGGAAIERRDVAAIARAFHDEHNRLYGYTLEAEETPIEIINVRLQTIGATERPNYAIEHDAGDDARHALKGRRSIYVPESASFAAVDVYDGHRLRCGNAIEGPAVIETVTTAVFISGSFDCVVDRYRSFVLYRKGREDLVRNAFERRTEEAMT